MLRRLLRVCVVVGGLGALCALAFSASRFAGGLAVIASLALVGSVSFWLPRGAHRAFVRGDFARAALWYRLLRPALFDPAARETVDLSLAATELARGDFERGRRRLDRVRDDALAEASRAAWLNNRAYALVRADGDADQALDLVERALALRPGVPGFCHTLGVALLAVGRTDAAVRALERVWDAVEDGRRAAVLEAERCYDLARAWDVKGHPDYARDYYERCRQSAPTSTWADQAAQALARGDAAPDAGRLRIALPDEVAAELGRG